MTGGPGATAADPYDYPAPTDRSKYDPYNDPEVLGTFLSQAVENAAKTDPALRGTLRRWDGLDTGTQERLVMTNAMRNRVREYSVAVEGLQFYTGMRQEIASNNPTASTNEPGHYKSRDPERPRRSLHYYEKSAEARLDDKAQVRLKELHDYGEVATESVIEARGNQVATLEKGIAEHLGKVLPPTNPARAAALGSSIALPNRTAATGPRGDERPAVTHHQAQNRPPGQGQPGAGPSW